MKEKGRIESVLEEKEAVGTNTKKMCVENLTNDGEDYVSSEYAIIGVKIKTGNGNMQ